MFKKTKTAHFGECKIHRSRNLHNDGSLMTRCFNTDNVIYTYQYEWNDIEVHVFVGFLFILEKYRCIPCLFVCCVIHQGICLSLSLLFCLFLWQRYNHSWYIDFLCTQS